ncbi:hypothetical protein GCM10011409_15250 [Lentibacillus populi]|uniref:DUF5082 domain-containing protein n=1 Tax=Lentibacillus populi TaxID=1827502 RepID=A0A9W5TWM3_9BACI|nr:DUF5082 family protein [Lentibacillus populi]GGB38694.1 hypothetical protein GCM10011409_15250 [Lentibacillus populi]
MDNSYQISQLTSEISTFNGVIKDNNEKIGRLEDSKIKIIADQDELSMQKGAVNQPDLSSETWQGKHTNDFLDKRENIKQEYNNMMNTQVGILLDNIANAIERLKKANLDLSSSIETNRYRIRQLREMEDD